MSASETRSEGTPLHHHPLMLPTLFVVGGWVLLLGGYIPGRPPSPSGARPDGFGSHANVAGSAEALEPAPPTVLTVDGRSSSNPIRLTIEFPNGPAGPASIAVRNPEPSGTPSPEARLQSESAPVDAQTIRTGMAPVEAAVVPPPIPGPPPDFDPTILSPLIRESVPVSPIFEDNTTAEALIARPMAELPDAFSPGPLLDRYRSDEPWVPEQDPPSTSTTAEAEPTSITIASPTRDRGDQAPEPPAVPDIMPPFSTTPVILPEPTTGTGEALPSTPDPAPSATLQSVASRYTDPPEPIRFPATPDRRGLRGLFRAFRPPPPIPLVPPPPGMPIPTADEARTSTSPN